jgi:hypothetical protein
MGCDLWFSSTLAEDVKIVVSRYWQAMCWWKIRCYRSVTISKECTGARSTMTEVRDFTRRGQVLASNALVRQ